MAKNASSTTNEVINSSFYAASQRVAILLLALAQDVDDRATSEDEPITLPYSNNDIAEMLGVSRNSVTASISRLQTQGVIAKQRNALIVLDLAKLEEIANLTVPV